MEFVYSSVDVMSRMKHVAWIRIAEGGPRPVDSEGPITENGYMRLRYA